MEKRLLSIRESAECLYVGQYAIRLVGFLKGDYGAFQPVHVRGELHFDQELSHLTAYLSAPDPEVIWIQFQF